MPQSLSRASLAVVASPRQTVADRVTELLREGIQKGDYAPGQRLIEAELTASFGVSRNALRESMRRLAGEGVIVIEPHRGAVVRRISKREIADLMLLRERVEGLAAGLAARNSVGESGRRRFDKILDRMRRAVRSGLLREYSEMNTSFHSLVAELADNKFLSEFIVNIKQPTIRLQFIQFTGSGDAAESLHDHEKIAAAILSGKQAAAERAMRSHIRRASKNLLAVNER